MAPTASTDALTALPLTALPLAALLKPRGIALVGVKGGAFDPAARDNMARRFLENLQRHGYQGRSTWSTRATTASAACRVTRASPRFQARSIRPC